MTTPSRSLLLLWTAAFTGYFADASLAVDSPNLITNGTFEEGATITDDNVPYPMKPWSDVKDHAIATYSLSQTEKNSGSNSISIARLEKTGNSRISVTGPKGIELQEGTRYVFTCMVKATEGQPGVIFNFKNTSGAIVPVTLDVSTAGASVGGSGQNVVALTVESSQNPKGFNELKVIFTTPAETLTLGMELNFSYTMGTAWFDDISLIQAD